MPKIFCANTDCTGCKDYLCIREFISIGENEDGVCENYECYLDTVEYQNEFYICVKAKGGKIAKALRKGKQIQYNGAIFYTTDKDTTPEYMTVTDAYTGKAGLLASLQKPNLWEKYLEIKKTTPNVQTLPLAEWDEKSREYIIVDSEETTDESKI